MKTPTLHYLTLLLWALPVSMLWANEGMDIGQYEFYTEEGLVFHAETDEVFTGYVIYLYSQGEVESRRAYVDGVLHGLCESWYESGYKKDEIPYENGVASGMAQGWHENGAPAFEGRYVNGRQDGVWRQWDAQGNLIAEHTYSAEPPSKFVFTPPKPPGS